MDQPGTLMEYIIQSRQLFTLIGPLDAARALAFTLAQATRGIVQVDGAGSLRRLHADGHRCQESFQDCLFIHADYRIIRARHSHVGLIGRPAWQDARIRRGHVRVRADDR